MRSVCHAGIGDADDDDWDSGMDENLLHGMDPTGRFTSRAADYVRYRPTYPAAAIDFILCGCISPFELTAADIGAGTGISARLLAERGVRVLAIEPNAAMREAAAAHERVLWLEGTAEETGLRAGCVDLVVSAQAFHWFRQREAVAEFHRIVRNGGRMALMWNSRDRRDSLTRGFIEAIHSVNGEHPAEQREIEPGVIEAEGRFKPPRLETFGHWQDLDCPGLIGRASSASYVPREGESFEILRDRLTALFDQFRDARGLVRILYVTKVYLADRL
jgi:SAM-dependent methyltransferase